MHIVKALRGLCIFQKENIKLGGESHGRKRRRILGKIMGVADLCAILKQQEYLLLLLPLLFHKGRLSWIV